MPDDIQELEVRCCCRPQNLLGHLAVPTALAYPNSLLQFRQERLTPIQAFNPNEPVDVVVDHAPPVAVLRVRWYWPNPDAPYLAVSSEDTSIEVLRTLPGFREARIK